MEWKLSVQIFVDIFDPTRISWLAQIILTTDKQFFSYLDYDWQSTEMNNKHSKQNRALVIMP